MHLLYYRTAACLEKSPPSLSAHPQAAQGVISHVFHGFHVHCWVMGAVIERAVERPKCEDFMFTVG